MNEVAGEDVVTFFSYHKEEDVSRSLSVFDEIDNINSIIMYQNLRKKKIVIQNNKSTCPKENTTR
jgi:hypothetical protein